MVEFCASCGVSPGRSGSVLSLAAGDLVEGTRADMTRSFGGSDPSRRCVVARASEAFDPLIQAMVVAGDHVASAVLAGAEPRRATVAAAGGPRGG